MSASGFEQRLISSIKGIGPRQGERLAHLGLRTYADALFHLPLRYQDRTRLHRIADCRVGMEVQIEGKILSSEHSRGRRRSLLCTVSDASGGQIVLRFFHFSPALERVYSSGALLRCFGEVREGPNGLELVHPECRRLDPQQPHPLDSCLTPVYPSTEGLSQYTLRLVIDQVLEQLAALDGQGLVDLVPAPVLAALGYPSVQQALEQLHRPDAHTDTAALLAGEHPAQRRLAFEELLAQQLGLRRLRAQLRSQRAPDLRSSDSAALRQRFLAQLPFTLTAAQQRVLQEIDADLDADRPMLRLVQGDVGSSKTVVAALAALRAVAAGAQVALMAPTELLAEQHQRNFQHWLAPLDIPMAWVAGKLKGRARTQTLQALSDGQVSVAVGTHALFQQGVQFANLGLVIIDEQHRFGVDQRLALREKGRAGLYCPHQLIMTATPIPRTLAMSAYADLDTSTIDQLPAGRSPITTVVMSETRRPEVIERVRAALASGRQAYWVCPLIDESEQLAAQAASETAAQLVELMPEVAIGLVHGRMKAADKEQVMSQFKAGALGLLVATTVIEVGVDVPNASLMIIDNAERLGLAQLHQLRGRVGRGSVASSCVLLYRPPLSEIARARLEVLRRCQDGFAIARRDLELRGPGEVLGTRQTGGIQLRVADLLRDEDLLPMVQQAADTLLRDHPEYVEPLTQRWLRSAERYGEV